MALSRTKGGVLRLYCAPQSYFFGTSVFMDTTTTNDQKRIIEKVYQKS